MYNNIFSRIIINGHLSDPVYVTRGVRQGCPLSPLLYVLFIEPIARFIMKNDNIVGFLIPGTNGKKVKFLQYADDATCVASSVNDMFNFIKVFDNFKKATGASVNVSKSCGLKLGSLSKLYIPLNLTWSTTFIKITGVYFCSRGQFILTGALLCNLLRNSLIFVNVGTCH